MKKIFNMLTDKTLLERAKIALESYTEEQLVQIIHQKTMNDIELYELVHVSNNSTITKNVRTMLNNQLTRTQKRDFRTWLRIVDLKCK